jgi:hypothetical protein
MANAATGSAAYRSCSRENSEIGSEIRIEVIEEGEFDEDKHLRRQAGRLPADHLA